MEKNSRQDNGSLGAHIARQAATCVQVLDRFSGRRWNRDICAGPYPGDHSLTEQDDESKAAAGGLAKGSRNNNRSVVVVALTLPMVADLDTF
jgi:hypothetical protein